MAKSIASVEAAITKRLGHFPMSENPHDFIGDLKPLPQKIETIARRRQAT